MNRTTCAVEAKPEGGRPFKPAQAPAVDAPEPRAAAPDASPLPRLRSRVLRMNAMGTGVAVGLTAAMVLFLMTNWLVLKGGETVGPHLALLGQVFLGYRVSFAGSLIGATYAFGAGWAAGYSGAGIYNVVAAFQSRGNSRPAGDGR